ncbi:MAG: hypothetical protein ACTSQD_02875 [Promethearchaeota archaeon]
MSLNRSSHQVENLITIPTLQILRVLASLSARSHTRRISGSVPFGTPPNFILLGELQIPARCYRRLKRLFI